MEEDPGEEEDEEEEGVGAKEVGGEVGEGEVKGWQLRVGDRWRRNVSLFASFDGGWGEKDGQPTSRIAASKKIPHHSVRRTYVNITMYALERIVTNNLRSAQLRLHCHSQREWKRTAHQ